MAWLYPMIYRMVIPKWIKPNGLYIVRLVCVCGGGRLKGFTWG